MKKDLIISLDDLWEGNDYWEEFEKLHQEFPELKITFFVIVGKCSDEFLKKVSRSWTELVFHCWSHHRKDWLGWSKEEAKEKLVEYQKYGFAKGFKAPHWRVTNEIIEACNELGFWVCSATTVKIDAKKCWYTYPVTGLTQYDKYDEFYGHLQDEELVKNLESLKKYCKENKPNYKFISEVIHEQ